MTDKTKKSGEETNAARRKLLRNTTAAAGVIAVAQTDWAKPVVDSIVLPAHAQTSNQTIAEIAAATADLSTLVSVLVQAQVDALNGPGPLTVYAPTNAAFAAIQATVDGLDAAGLLAVTNYHVVAGSQPFSPTPTTTNTAPNLVATVEASNGTVYVIDQVLVPPA